MYKEVFEKFIEVCENNGICCCPAQFIPIAEALKKQTPQKPKAVRSHDFKGFALGDCPVCDRTVDNNEHYCFNYGQRLDWEAEK